VGGALHSLQRARGRVLHQAAPSSGHWAAGPRPQMRRGFPWGSVLSAAAFEKASGSTFCTASWPSTESPELPHAQETVQGTARVYQQP